MIDRMMGYDPAQAGHEPQCHTSGPANAVGEIKGIGPSWVCDNYAEPGHDYGSCRDCYSNYETNFLPRLKREAA
jgi:hypothetical protein